MIHGTGLRHDSSVKTDSRHTLSQFSTVNVTCKHHKAHEQPKKYTGLYRLQIQGNVVALIQYAKQDASFGTECTACVVLYIPIHVIFS